jgi:hypothetical protein
MTRAAVIDPDAPSTLRSAGVGCGGEAEADEGGVAGRCGVAAGQDERPGLLVGAAGGLESFARTNRLRTRGTDALLAAAREAGVQRFVAQSYAIHRYAREGGPVKTEDDVRPDAGAGDAGDRKMP